MPYSKQTKEPGLESEDMVCNLFFIPLELNPLSLSVLIFKVGTTNLGLNKRDEKEPNVMLGINRYLASM